jgi:Fe-S-cluster containining protein
LRDGPGRRVLKRLVRWNFTLNLWVSRAWHRHRYGAPFRLGGDCRRCARCCEAPAIQVGKPTFYLPTLRRLFLSWQERVNGFVLVGRDRAERTFIFRCTHFDPATRSCDSYDSRPGICRDYPRALLFQGDPEMLPGCGYRPVAANAEGLLRSLSLRPLSPEQRAKLTRGLRLEK